MRVKCEKCNTDITEIASYKFEKNEVGQIQCPHCQKIQKRYISESDLLLYLAISETYYVILSFITIQALNHFGITWYVAIGFGVLLVGSYYLFKEMGTQIYDKGYFKKETMHSKFSEDRESIKKSMSWQTLLFYAIAITYFTGTEFSLFFFFALLLANIMTYIKFFLSVRNEKQ